MGIHQSQNSTSLVIDWQFSNESIYHAKNGNMPKSWNMVFQLNLLPPFTLRSLEDNQIESCCSKKLWLLWQSVVGGYWKAFICLCVFPRFLSVSCCLCCIFTQNTPAMSSLCLNSYKSFYNLCYNENNQSQ